MISSEHQLTTHTPPDEGWFKSSYSTGACTCVEVRFDPGGKVWIRDSKYEPDPARLSEQPMIVLSPAGWRRLAKMILAGEAVMVEGTLIVRLLADGSATLTCSRTGVTLAFSHDEVSAFTAGLRAGEFGPLRAA